MLLPTTVIDDGDGFDSAIVSILKSQHSEAVHSRRVDFTRNFTCEHKTVTLHTKLQSSLLTDRLGSYVDLI